MLQKQCPKTIFFLFKFFRTVDFPERNGRVNDILCHVSFFKNSISRSFLRGLEPNKACLSAWIVREIAFQPYLQFLYIISSNISSGTELAHLESGSSDVHACSVMTHCL